MTLRCKKLFDKYWNRYNYQNWIGHVTFDLVESVTISLVPGLLCCSFKFKYLSFCVKLSFFSLKSFIPNSIKAIKIKTMINYIK
jgi:hypothetical protein